MHSTASRRSDGVVHSISTLPRSPRVDRDERLRAYLVSMGVRTACFVLGGVFGVWLHWFWPAVLCLVAAALLPYPAVVIANNVNRREEPGERLDPHRAIGPGGASGLGPGSGPHGPDDLDDADDPDDAGDR